LSAPRHRDLVALEAKPDAKDRELLAVSKELAKVQHKLRVAHALIDLQKKRTRYWDSHSPSSTG